jgi:hypothetical protein
MCHENIANKRLSEVAEKSIMLKLISGKYQARVCCTGKAYMYKPYE